MLACIPIGLVTQRLRDNIVYIMLKASKLMYDLMCLQYCNGGDLADYLQGALFVCVTIA